MAFVTRPGIAFLRHFLKTHPSGEACLVANVRFPTNLSEPVTYTTWRYDPYHYCLAVLMERFAYFLGRENAQGDVMAESRGGKEDMRLKESFTRLWEQGTQYTEPKQFQERFTSKQLKVKTKSNNIAGLQICDLLAHSSRHEILWENGLIERPPAAFGEKVIRILQQKYDQRGSRMLGKKLL